MKRRTKLYKCQNSDKTWTYWWRNKELILDNNNTHYLDDLYLTAKSAKIMKPNGRVIRVKMPCFIEPRNGRKKTHVRAVHSIIMKLPNHSWKKVIHLDGDPWNCRKKNLRIVSQSCKNWTKLLRRTKRES
jgi:hypothetical protein